MEKRSFVLSLVVLISLSFQARADCGNHGLWLQVLGSGGPELDDARASSGYLIWEDGRARLLVDLGSGSLLRLKQSGADINELDAILLSHLHVDHSNDLPALMKAAYFTGRSQDLPLFGPSGNSLMPSTVAYVDKLFGEDGAYRYLASYLDGSDSFRLIPHDVDTNIPKLQIVWKSRGIELTAVTVHHGPIPALAWRVMINDKAVVFSGDMNNEYGTLAKLASNADLLVAHNAVPEGVNGAARQLHMPPSEIGKIAAKAGVKQVLLSHRMKRTLGKEPQTLKVIRQSYQGVVEFADDLQCVKI